MKRRIFSLKLDGQVVQLQKEDKLKIMTNEVDVLIS